MKNVTGFLIRKHRLAQNLSQEGLCKGICAVSYLSKIEQGQVEAGEDIIRRLFEALGIVYAADEAFLRDMRAALRAFFDRFFHGEPTDAERAVIDAQAERLESSLLYIDYRLYQAYALFSLEDGTEGLLILRSLTPFAEYMDEEAAFLFAFGLSLVLKDEAEALEAVARAKALNPCSLVYLRDVKLRYRRGRYLDTLTHIHQGLHVAMEEGNLVVMRELSFLEGCCYANLLSRPLMLRAFRRAAALFRGDRQQEARIHYNIGATLVEMRAYDEAMPYLLGALDALGGDPLSYFFACHKLAIACLELDRAEEGRTFVKQAEATLVAWPDWPDVYEKMLAVVRMRYEPGYLDSDDYLSTLREVYDRIAEITSFGFKQFHGHFLIDAYTHRRKYKEALAVAREINTNFSDL